VKEGETSKGFAFFGIGVENANMDILSRICVRTPVKLAGLKFKDMFAWLSSSLSRVSSSQPGTPVQIAAPSGWTEEGRTSKSPREAPRRACRTRPSNCTDGAHQNLAF
jgi:hypothetical protein